MSKILCFDTETTGKWNKKIDALHPDQARMVSLAAVIAKDDGQIINSINLIVKPQGFVIPKEATGIHGITTEYALKFGLPLTAVAYMFNVMVCACDELLAFNIEFDFNIMNAELLRAKQVTTTFNNRPKLCAMLGSKNILKMPGQYGDYKWPKLEEAHEHFFGVKHDGAHDAFADLVATLKVHGAIVKWHKDQTKPDDSDDVLLV